MMEEVFIKVKALEDIPAHRLCNLGTPDEEEGLPTVVLPEEGWPPDFVSVRELKAGEISTVVLKPHDVWMVEAGADLPAGMSVSTMQDGRVGRAMHTENKTPANIGFTLNAAKEGELVKIYRNYKIRPEWLERVDNFINQ